MAPPFQNRRSPLWKIAGWYLVALFAHGVIDKGGPDPFMWSLKALVVGWLTVWFVRAVRDGRIPISWLASLISTTPAEEVVIRDDMRTPGEAVRAEVSRLGGGAYLGISRRGGWVLADPEHAVMVLGPPRSGKTSAVMIPALMACSGAAVSTSTKPDVMDATVIARSEVGQAWLFDPSAGERRLPEGVRRLCWSPVAAASSWDEALVMARAMTACTRVGSGTTNENHWTERAAALLAPLLYAAQLTGRPIGEVLRWTLRQDLAPAMDALADGGSGDRGRRAGRDRED